jgi:tellurite resistance protein TehA-like permease
MKTLLIILFMALAIAHSHAQDFSDFLPSEPPKDAKENTKLLFTGIALQAAGIGLTAASAYFYLEVPDDQYEIAYTGFTFGLGIAAAGTALMIGSIHNIAAARRSMHEIKKAQKHPNVSFHLEPTHYGVGLVCRF